MQLEIIYNQKQRNKVNKCVNDWDYGTNCMELNNKCVLPFGKQVGYVKDVPAFSNCDNEVIAKDSNFILINEKKPIITGMKWQCVEFARRYLITKLGVSFKDVDSAEEIWYLGHVNSIINNKKHIFKSYMNGIFNDNTNMPREHDIIIWAKHDPNIPYGHIAVILKVENHQIFIGEQNWYNGDWCHETYSRILRLKKGLGNSLEIVDNDHKILGWMRVIF